VDRTPQSQICFSADFRCEKGKKKLRFSQGGHSARPFPSGENMGDKKAKPASPAGKPTKKK